MGKGHEIVVQCTPIIDSKVPFLSIFIASQRGSIVYSEFAVSRDSVHAFNRQVDLRISLLISLRVFSETGLIVDGVEIMVL